IEHKGKRKSLWAVAQPKFISPLPLGYALHTLEEGDFFRKFVKIKRGWDISNSANDKQYWKQGGMERRTLDSCGKERKT
ncbi:hypothetical protein M3568_19460, partial [Priestia flexa]|uniref:hypothetical protein n=1 Tax=Priestia flexa TaxID=86664 RepID=UPI00203ACC7E